MRDITLHRYLYVLIKMFSLNGNTVILPLYKELIKILNNIPKVNLNMLCSS